VGGLCRKDNGGLEGCWVSVEFGEEWMGRKELIDVSLRYP